MRRLATIGVLGALSALPAAAAAMQQGSGSGATVSIGYISYSPAHLDVLAGDTVAWSNDSARGHTVNSDDGTWASDRLAPGDRYAHRFDGSGAFTYYCTLHAGMRGEVDVHRLLLDPQSEDAGAGASVALTGRAALAPGSTVDVEGDSGAGYRPAGHGTVAADGTFKVDVRPPTTTSYRAVAPDGEASPPVLLRVLDRTVTARAVRHGVRVVVSAQVLPASPGATVVLQRHLRERFGWWPVRTGRLNAASRVRFVLRADRPVVARVLLTRSDGATRLAQSGVVRVGR